MKNDLHKFLITFINRQFFQIKKGGIGAVIKKLRSLFYLFLGSPIYIIAVPTVMVLYLIRPFYLVRWQELHSGRIGHFASETELYFCERDAGINVPSQRYIDLWFLQKYGCNRQLEKMWRRKLIILPRWILIPLFRVNRLFLLRNKQDSIDKNVWETKSYEDFVAIKNYHEIGLNTNNMRDVHNLLEQSQPHLSFTHDEEIKGKEILKKLGVPENSKFVCLIVRDSAYLTEQRKYAYNRDNSYHNYRDGNIEKYVLAAEELATRGYYIFRMGTKVLRPLKSSNPKVIDYATLGIRSDFMDIYLGAKCSFCISTDAGYRYVPVIFRKPIVNIPLPLGFINTSSQKDLIIVKHHVHKKYKKKLTISEIFASNVALAFFSNQFEQNDVELEENSPEEIRDLAIEMDDRINGNWNETEEDLLLQKKFWSVFTENIKRLNLEKPLHGKIKARFGAKFLRENKNWIK